MNRDLALEKQTNHFVVRSITCAHPTLVILEQMALEPRAEEDSG